MRSWCSLELVDTLRIFFLLLYKQSTARLSYTKIRSATCLGSVVLAAAAKQTAAVAATVINKAEVNRAHQMVRAGISKRKNKYFCPREGQLFNLPVLGVDKHMLWCSSQWVVWWSLGYLGLPMLRWAVETRQTTINLVPWKLLQVVQHRLTRS